jgi:hypothetical protein
VGGSRRSAYQYAVEVSAMLELSQLANRKHVVIGWRMAQEMRCTGPRLEGTIPRCFRWEGPLTFTPLSEEEALHVVHVVMNAARDSRGMQLSLCPPQDLPGMMFYSLSPANPKLDELYRSPAYSNSSVAEPASNLDAPFSRQKKVVRLSMSLAYALQQRGSGAVSGDVFLFSQLLQVGGHTLAYSLSVVLLNLFKRTHCVLRQGLRQISHDI